MRYWLSSVVSSVVHFMWHRGGNVAVIFGIAMIPLAVTIGASVDVSRSLVVRARLSQALDAAGLAVGSATEMQEDDLVQLAQDFFAANYRESEMGVLGQLTVQFNEGVIVLNATASVPTSIMGIVGIDEVNVAARSEVTRESNGLEVVLVLDNTGSMLSNNKIGALRNAARDLVDILFGDDPHPELMRMGLVPFVTGVNVRSAGSFSWSWIDTEARSQYHGENFDLLNGARVNHLELFEEIGVDWLGCVESRPYPYDVNDAAPNSSIPNTLFVPYFWPDESSSYSYNNNYLSDNYEDPNASNNEPVCVRYNRRGRCTRWSNGGGGGGNSNPTTEEIQSNLNKYYDNPNPSIDQTPSNTRGPNMSCPRPIVPLTNDRDFLLDEIDAMEAMNNSGTHVSNGLSWGWRVLSPTAPYTEGAAYDDPDSSKALILLTDGDNTMCCQSSHNNSDYTSYGYAARGRLGTTNANYAADEIDDRVEELCNNIRGTGIRVYTITFQVSSSGIRNLFRGCATTPDLYFDSPNVNDLQRVFQAIGRDLSNLRISG